MGSRFYIVTLPAQPFCMGYPEELCWTWFDILVYASTTQKVICSFELSPFSYIPTFIYQLTVRSSRALVLSMPITLVVCQAILFWNDQEKQTPVPHPYLGLGQSSCIPQVKMPIQLLILFYPEVLPSWCQECHENCTNSYEFLMKWYFSPSSFVPRFRVVATGIPTSEPWCVKSILLATPLLGG